MTLFKATAEGNVEMSPEEEAEIRAHWAKAEQNVNPPRPTPVLERLKQLEERVKLLESASGTSGQTPAEG